MIGQSIIIQNLAKNDNLREYRRTLGKRIPRRWDLKNL